MKKPKDHCKKCGQKLPEPPPAPPAKRYPLYLHGTIILPNVKHAEQPVTLKRRCAPHYFPWDQVGYYTNDREVVFGPMEENVTIPDKMILHLEGTFHLVPMSTTCRVLNKGDQVTFGKENFTFVAPEDLKE